MSLSEMLDSRTQLTVSPKPVYLDSRPCDQAAPSAAGGFFASCVAIPRGQVISGTYYASPSPEECLLEDAQLASEFQAWDTLSDEALEVFERQIEETK